MIMIDAQYDLVPLYFFQPKVLVPSHFAHDPSSKHKKEDNVTKNIVSQISTT